MPTTRNIIAGLLGAVGALLLFTETDAHAGCFTDPAPSCLPNPGEVCLFADADCKGDSYRIGIGTSWSTMGGSGRLPNDWLSSFLVGDNHTALLLCADSNFSGYCHYDALNGSAYPRRGLASLPKHTTFFYPSPCNPQIQTCNDWTSSLSVTYQNCTRTPENQTMELSCPPGQVMGPALHALYGRSNPNNPTSYEWCSHNIYTAAFADARAIVNANCQGRASCSIDVNNGVFGDPCPGYVKYLHVQVPCGP